MHFYKDTLVGKVALVTGAGSGIGKATAKLLAFSGARVALLDQNGAEIQATYDEISHSGAEVLMVSADISNAAQVEAAYKKIEETWNRLDIVVANAGINGLWAPLENIYTDG